MNQEPWETLEKFVSLNSPWLTVIGEKIKDNQGKVLEYWRLEKADSVIVIPLQNGRFVLPKPMYRPGLGKMTLDFPGGRLPKGQKTTAAALTILERELGVTEDCLISLNKVNQDAWAINSTFSNQKLYGFVAEIDPKLTFDPEKLGRTYPNKKTGINALLQELTCLQCRGLLLELLYR
jgi:hypothetical protein